ncbi:MAG: DUF512 domain-containing protein [Calditrichaceae bacterium]|nr:DUF512 domain-containing protein [Calditrichaceae bacterium]MBN2707511.1 DUF512 domain-containing protein [Calditrichaceae bacterium]RQV95600.1 MAG: DUF512 domain-containing protein [Calditrichota bacterium]
MLKIVDIESGSIARELNIKPDDYLISINNHLISDRLDYRFFQAEEYVEVCIQSEDGQTIYEIEKDIDEDLGLILEEMKMKVCGNNCVFCFVYQNPRGMRKALYFKDEDYRFSFLYGHYVTTTTLKQADLERIVEQRLSPLYISVHSTEEKTRRFLLGIKRDDHLMDKIEYLTAHGIVLHTQVVLCPGINDGPVFEKTINDLKQYYPGVRSVAVVPVGLTRHRENLTPLRMHTPEELKQTIAQTNALRNKLEKELGENFIYLADEFFIKAGMSLPKAGYYDEFYQIENGVGEFREMIDRFNEALPGFPSKLERLVRITWVTGMLAAGFLENFIIKPLVNNIENLHVNLIQITNEFYGPTIGVSGLLTGNDIFNTLKDIKLGDLVLLPPRILNDDGLLLDDWTINQLTDALNTPCHVVTEPIENIVETIIRCT